MKKFNAGNGVDMQFLKSLHAVWLFFVALLAGCATSTEQPEIHNGMGMVESHDGVPIVYESFGQGDTVVVFIHCWACNRKFWLDQIDPVVEAGYRVVTLDLPGHGESGADREVWSLTGLGDDVEAVITALDLKRVVLVGHDIGARAALTAAAQMPDRVIGIGCVDSLRNAEFEWPEGVFELIAEYVRENFHEGMVSVISSSMHPGTHPRLADWIFEESLRSDQEAMAALLAKFGTPDLAEQLSAVEVPVRCINAAPSGQRSLSTEIEMNRKYADFDAVLVDGVGHYMQLEQPEVFNPHLLDILAEFSGSDR